MADSPKEETSKTTISIVLAFDRKYVIGALATIASCIDNIDQNHRISLYIIPCDETPLEELLRNALDHLLKEEHSIHFLSFDQKLIDGFYNPRSDTNSSFFAVFYLASLLPHLDRVLFLDCDVIVNVNLADLWHFNLNGFPVGAVLDYGRCTLSADIKNCGELGLDPTAPAFNSGVMLINLGLWKQQEIENKLIQVANNSSIHRSLNDQSCLNIVFINNWRSIPKRWNRFYSLRPEKIIPVPFGPCIIYLGWTTKPWHFSPINSFGVIKLFYQYLDLTNWSSLLETNDQYFIRKQRLKWLFQYTRFRLSECKSYLKNILRGRETPFPFKNRRQGKGGTR
jgi:lipopolysaccharide biosynthesis glycosyltransferase